MEKLIPIVNRIQDVLAASNIPNTISLPRIVVVGSQSSGKSSVLESIVGRDFLPRGSGIVTRCPLQLKLVKIQEDVEYGVFSHLVDLRFENFEDIREEISIRTQDLTGNGKTITTKPIDLTIYSPRVLDISLVDLPGIVKISVAGQHQDLCNRIREMIVDYISSPNSIILAISAANNDLANSDALQIAHQVDPNGERTLGVLTKIDIMDKGTDAVSMLNGSLFPLRLGYVGVVCRSQEDINNNVPMEVHLQKEESFFRESPIYGKYSGRCGIKYLTTRLNTLLMNHIHKNLPDVRQNVVNLLQAVESELDSYGEVLQGNDEKSAVLLNVIQKVVRSYQDNVDGRNIKNVTEQLLGGARIGYIFNNMFRGTIENINPLDEVSDQDIRTAMMNAGGLRGSLFIPESAFENLVRKQIPRLREPSIRCMNLVYEELKGIIYKLDIPELERFTNLKERVVEVINTLLTRCIEPTSHMIHSIIDIEMSYVNTKHPHFIGGPKAILESQNKLKAPALDLALDKKPVSPPKIEEVSSSLFWPFSKREAKKERSMRFEDIEQKGKEIYLPPMVIKASQNPSQEETEQTELIKILINSYYSILKISITDFVPKTIMGFLVNKSREELQRELVKSLYKESLFDVLLEEGGDIRPRRDKCWQIVQGLRKALDILNEVREYKLTDN